MHRILLFGDLHIGLNHITYQVNDFSNISSANNSFVWWLYTKKYITDTINQIKIKYPDDTFDIVFLGDIYNEPKTQPELLNEMKYLLIYLKSKLSINKIYLLVGNHDTTEYLKENSSPLFMLTDDIVRIIYDIVVINNKGIDYVFIPFTDKLFDVLNKKNMNISNNYILFSHNNLFINDEYFGIPVMDIHGLYKALKKESLFTVNGHLHKAKLDISKHFLNIGSVSPCRFNEDAYQKYGISILSIDNNIPQIESFANTFIYFFVIEDINDIATVGKQLDEINSRIDHDYIVYLKYNYIYEDYIKELCQTYKNIKFLSKIINNLEDEEMEETLDVKKLNMDDDISLEENMAIDIKNEFWDYMKEQFDIDIDKLNEKIKDVV